MTSRRWSVSPAGSNWGRWGEADELGTLNLIAPDHVLVAKEEIKLGISFSLSLPLDLPSLEELNPARKKPKIYAVERMNEVYYNFEWSKINSKLNDVASDDAVYLYNQFSTHWDGLAHRGSMFDVGNTGEKEPVYFNGYKAKNDFKLHTDKTVKASSLGVENMAQHCIQGRGVLLNLVKHFGRSRTKVIGYDELMKAIDEDSIEIETGDILCFWTGFDEKLLSSSSNIGSTLSTGWMGLDGDDLNLLNWISDSGIAAIASDNRSIEIEQPSNRQTNRSTNLPLHEHCLFRLGMPLGELWHLSELANKMAQDNRFRFFLTAPPLRLTGAVGSPVTPVATL